MVSGVLAPHKLASFEKIMVDIYPSGKAASKELQKKLLH